MREHECGEEARLFTVLSPLPYPPRPDNYLEKVGEEDRPWWQWWKF